MQIYEDSNISQKLTCSTGKKDGNKLGRKKRGLMYYPIHIIDNKYIIMHPDCHRPLLKHLKGEDDG